MMVGRRGGRNKVLRGDSQLQVGWGGYTPKPSPGDTLPPAGPMASGLGHPSQTALPTGTGVQTREPVRGISSHSSHQPRWDFISPNCEPT